MDKINFLTIDLLKQIVPISMNVDAMLLEPFIPTAEEMNVNPILGLALTNELLVAIESGVVTGNTLTLLNDYIIPASAWSTFYEAAPFIIYRSVNAGITKKQSDNSTALDQSEFAVYRQSINDKSVFYLNRLINYLEDNKALYPNYRVNEIGCGIDRVNSSGFYLG